MDESGELLFHSDRGTAAADVSCERKQFLADTAKEYKADGVIISQMKFCEYWSYERTIDTLILPRDFGIPVCSIEKEYVNLAVGQLRTRFQAFVEALEIKRIQKERQGGAG